MKLSTLDICIFLLCMFVTLFVVLYGNRRTGSKEADSFVDYLLMGRQLTLPMFMMTLVATWYGGIFGVTQIAFEKGIFNFLTQGVFWYLTYIVFALFLAEKIHSSNAMTLAQLVGNMFGPRSRKVAALFNFINVIPVAYSISLGLLIDSLFGIGFEVSMIVGVIFVILYCMYGGFKAVVLSDMVQFFIMCTSVLMIAVFSASKYGGVDFLVKSLPETHFEILGGESLLSTLVWGFIALATLVDPNFYQRCFAAKSPKVAKRGILLSTLVWFFFDICTTMGGMYARAVMPEAKSSEAYLSYSFSILPDGLKGFFLAGVVATILSTMDSYLFVASNSLSFDLFPSSKFNRTKHIFGLVFVGTLTIFMSFAFDGDIKMVWKTLGSYSASCLLFPVMIGLLLPKSISDNEFLIMVSCGVLSVSIWKLAPLIALDELYIGLLATILSLGIIKLLKACFKRPNPS